MLNINDVGFEGRTTESIVGELRRFYSEEKENELGAVAIEVAVVPEKELEKPKVLTKIVPT